MLPTAEPTVQLQPRMPEELLHTQDTKPIKGHKQMMLMPNKSADMLLHACHAAHAANKKCDLLLNVYLVRSSTLCMVPGTCN
jgi:hypothetical protein